MAFLVKISSWACGALMKRCALVRAPSYASVASAASLYALRLMGAYDGLHEPGHRVDDDPRLLGAVGRVEVDDRPPVDLEVEDREVLADAGDVEGVGAGGHRSLRKAS